MALAAFGACKRFARESRKAHVSFVGTLLGVGIGLGNGMAIVSG